ncbi:glycosyltransferase family 39 protein [Fructobacillus sp. W13]|uniref:Glycosyltransferase family 39 protein n=1 Tax=Fructobacillus apis TaxID=2935017 RepID=A0ABT0ZPV7_9LACO|nr:glycosyltransferase family 39 protein [Fructobacillus apis]MCO0832012.1 glycosyltransferase family 39 protein [Fructobacillus apis]
MRKLTFKKPDWYLIGILLLAVFLYGWGIWDAGSANSYYTAAITSMTQSWHNFWYGAFDPAGFITVDKPPIALWFMAASAKLFGIHGWSIVLPSVLAGVGSVYLLYRLLAKRFGVWAGRLAALVMTLTPTVVANSRTNNMDAILVFFLLLAVYVLTRAVARKNLWLVLGAFAIIGVAFNIKMLQAFMILPAMFFYFIIATKVKGSKKTLWLLAAIASLGLFTVAYPATVDSASKTSRPYIGSSQTNSLMELAFGYNGTERLLGQTSGTGGSFSGMGKNSKQSKQGNGQATIPKNNSQGNSNNNNSNNNTSNQANNNGSNSTNTNNTVNSNNSSNTTNNSTQTPPSGAPNGQGKNSSNGAPNPPSGSTKGKPSGTPPSGKIGNPGQNGKGGPKQKGGPGKGGMGGGNSAFAIGSAGPFRLFQSDLGSQIGWFLPFAFLGMGTGLWAFRNKQNKWYQLSKRQQETLLWSGWFVPVYGFFSVASFFHPYYTIMLAPAIAALTAIAVVATVKMVKEGTKNERLVAKGFMGLTIVGTAALQAYYAWSYYPVVAITIVVMAIAATALLVIPNPINKQIKIASAILVLSLLSGFWALTPTLSHNSAAIPAASPSLLSQKGSSDMGGQVDSELLSYVEKNQEKAKYLFATTDSNSASGYIIKSKKAVMALGGYNGTDPTMTLSQFKKLVKSGELRYFVVGNTKSSTGNIAKILSWVQENGTQVTYSNTSKNNSNQQQGPQMGGGSGNSTLYDLSSLAK